MAAGPYSPAVEDHFARPRHAGSLPAGEGLEIRGEAGSEEEGARVVVAARIAGEGADARIVAIGWRVWGCPHTIAAMSLAAERLHGGPVAAFGTLGAGTLGASLDVPDEKRSRLLIVEDALHKCLADWDNKRLSSNRSHPVEH